MNHEEVIHSEFIIDEINVKTIEESINLINKIEADYKLYNITTRKTKKNIKSAFL